MSDQPAPLGCAIAVALFSVIGAIGSVVYAILKLIALVKFVFWGIQ